MSDVFDDAKVYDEALEKIALERDAWGRDLALREAWVIHEPSLTIGPVKKYWDGTTEMFSSPVNDLAVPSPVLELVTGHAFVAKRQDEFVELDARAIRFYEAIQAGLTGLIVVSGRNAAASGVPQDVGLALTVAALRAQLAAIEATASKAPDEEVMG